VKEESKEMINDQITLRGITDKDVLTVMADLDRNEFVPEKYKKLAYEDHPLPIGEGQTISQPYIVARMSELLALSGTEKILEIGTGSGYQSAILAKLSKEVYTIERIESLSKTAQQTLLKLGYKNIFFKTGDGTEGWNDKSPFDRVIITAASERVPSPLLEQLADSGKLLMPLGGPHLQQLTLIEKHGSQFTKEFFDACVFVPLIGKFS
jgi:protein-L-isoaspartate(D-aspartate) O-methyltransferase